MSISPENRRYTFSPYEVLTGMEAMQEGYDGSGLGLLLRGVSFEDYKYKKEEQIILSGIAHTEQAFNRLQRLMEERGFEQDYDHRFKVNADLVEAKDRYQYIVRVYNKPDGLTTEELEERLMQTRLFLRKNGEEHGNDLTIFSFWSDVVTIKEVGWPLQVGDALGLNDDRIKPEWLWPRDGRTPTMVLISMPVILSLFRALPP